METKPIHDEVEQSDRDRNARAQLADMVWQQMSGTPFEGYKRARR